MPGENPAPGAPGIPARWTSSAKSAVGTALRARSRVWFTLSHGILNEVYYPRIDQACTRDFGLIVTDGRGFFSEQKRDTRSSVHPIEHGVPAFAIDSACIQGRYRLRKLVLSDPRRDVVLQRIEFQPLVGDIGGYRPPPRPPPRPASPPAPSPASAGAENRVGVRCSPGGGDTPPASPAP